MIFHALILTFLLFTSDKNCCHSFTIIPKRPATTTSSTFRSPPRQSSPLFAAFSHDEPSSSRRRDLTALNFTKIDSPPCSTKVVDLLCAGDHVPLDYDDIQNKMIDVSKPYYKLENESAVNIGSSTGFVCTVVPEMSIGREAGSHMPCAEVGRHCAIAGSVVAALNQPASRSSTKHYYLALDCQLEVCSSLTQMQDHLFRTQMPITNDLKNKGHVVISAVCHELERRNASCEVLMQFPRSYGTKPVFYLLRVNYVVMTPKVFQRFSPKSLLSSAVGAANNGSKNQQQQQEKLSTSRLPVLPISDTNKSPYAQFKGLNDMDCSTEIVSKSKSKVFMTKKIPKIRPESCLGHFKEYPALPIAFLCAFCADICGEAIAALTDTPIPFRRHHAGPAENFSVPHQQGGNMLKFEASDVIAHKLVYAGDHNNGLIITCEMEKIHASTSEGAGEATDESRNDVFLSHISVVAPTTPPNGGPAKEEFIGNMNFTFSLV